MEDFGLGLARDGRVELKVHQAEWDRAFIFESERIQKAISDFPMSLHHMGSTSISTISAKPILDILAEVSSIEKMDKAQSVLEALGYEYKGEYGIPGRRYCVLYNTDKTKGFVHLHAFEFGDKEIQKHLLFRDYLRTFPDVAKAYENLKKDLSLKFKRSEYSEMKSEFIKKTLIEARAELTR
ncbi:hypothetical protein AZI86_14805 [Bdellovibrio bacteriovorus]|uniref:Glutamate-rich protein grpB n=2 Tax=Bdellovibrio bacteriovorus TaxID=959 RepID=A0A150WK48_BDEBC|nr:hypothetical protein AZI86_14805 [Bdellovibrio bacteriovorus]